MSIIWHCDREGCAYEVKGTKGHRIILQSKAPAVEVNGARYEFCTYECLVLFVVQESYLLK